MSVLGVNEKKLAAELAAALNVRPGDTIGSLLEQAAVAAFPRIWAEIRDRTEVEIRITLKTKGNADGHPEL